MMSLCLSHIFAFLDSRVISSLVTQMVESTCNAGDLGLIPELGNTPWRRKWQPTPVFLPGKSHGWSSLAGYSPWGCKELDMTEQLTHKDKKTKGQREKVWNENQHTIKRRKADLGVGRMHFVPHHLLLGSPLWCTLHVSLSLLMAARCIRELISPGSNVQPIMIEEVYKYPSFLTLLGGSSCSTVIPRVLQWD